MWCSKLKVLCLCRTLGLFDYRIALISVLLMAAAVASAGQSQLDIKDVFRNELACLLIKPLLADMPVAPVFAQDDGCVSVVPDDEQGTNYFIDDRLV